MEPETAQAEETGSEPGQPALHVSIRYFAGARAAAGVDEEDLWLPAATNLDQLVRDLASRGGPALAPILEISSFLVNEVAAGRIDQIPPNAQIDVLPPFAGG